MLGVRVRGLRGPGWPSRDRPVRLDEAARAEGAPAAGAAGWGAERKT